MRVLPGERLHRRSGAPVGIALAQHRIDRRPEHPGEAGLESPLGVAPGLVGVVGDVVALGLQLRDGGPQLEDRGADVGQLDDVRHRRPGQLSQPGQLVGGLLALGQPVGERRDDPACQGDIVRFEFHPVPLAYACTIGNSE